MKHKRKLQKQRDRKIARLKLLLNSFYGKMVYVDTDSVTPEANYIEQNNIIIQDFFKKQEV